MIDVQHVSKEYRIYHERHRSFKDYLVLRRNRYEKFRALQDISFRIGAGEMVGLIGTNGSGKSTMLKLLSQVLFPDQGSVRLGGRVSALLELGSGFHPEFTGRENIFMYSAILGIKRKQIEERLEAIVRFAEMERFIDNALKTYSSGMQARLAFSVAVHVDPDILLLDEVLAVGDASFQARSFEKIDEFRTQGKTIVLVSHNTDSIGMICDRALWLDKGVLRKDDKARAVVDDYHEYVYRDRVAKESTVPVAVPEPAIQPAGGQRWGSGEVLIERIEMVDAQGRSLTHFEVGEPVRIRIYYNPQTRVEDAVFGISIHRNDGVHCYGVNTALDGLMMQPLERPGLIEVALDRMTLLEGGYHLDVAVHRKDGQPYDYHTKALAFRTMGASREVGVLSLPHRWISE